MQPNTTPDETLGKLIQARRQALGLTLAQLGELAGLNKSTILRLEQDQFATPAPDGLTRVAQVLHIPTADLFALAGYSTAQDVPSLRPYLRAKFGNLPESAMDEVEAYLASVAAHYGDQSSGPQEGEDEIPE